MHVTKITYQILYALSNNRYHQNKDKRNSSSDRVKWRDLGNKLTYQLNKKIKIIQLLKLIQYSQRQKCDPIFRYKMI